MSSGADAAGVEVIGAPVNPTQSEGLGPLRAVPPHVGVIGYQPFASPSSAPGTSQTARLGPRAGELADQLGITPAQVMLRFALQQPAVSSVVMGTSSVEHLLENVSGFSGAWEASPIVW